MLRKNRRTGLSPEPYTSPSSGRRSPRGCRQRPARLGVRARPVSVSPYPYRFGSFADANVPFPRTCGARFGGAGLLICFGGRRGGRPMAAAERGVTPRSLSALGGALFGSGAGGDRVFVYDVSPLFPMRRDLAEAYRTDFVADAAAASPTSSASGTLTTTARIRDRKHIVDMVAYQQVCKCPMSLHVHRRCPLSHLVNTVA